MGQPTAYDTLLADLGATFRPQRQWAEGRGLLLIAGHFLTGVGAGTWLFALWFGYPPGLPLAIGAVALGGLAHFGFLGQPMRFWRMFRVRTSWIARGFVGMNLFLAGAVLYVLAPRGVAGELFLALSLAGAAILILYKGNVYAASRGVPFWNSPVVPVLYATYALRGGVACLLAAQGLTGDALEAEPIGLIELWVAVSAAVMLGFYLGVMRRASVTARRSVFELTRGRVAAAFYLGTVGAGLAAPILLGLVGLGRPLSGQLLALVGLLSLVGDFFAKYAIARAGVYLPPVADARSLAADR